MPGHLALGVAALQSVDPTGGGPVALLVTFLLATAFYAVTLHLAAVFFVGDVATQKAVMAAVVPAITAILLRPWLDQPSGPAIFIAMTLLGDFLAIRYSYKLPMRSSIALTALHFAFAVALVIPLNNIFGFV